MKLRFAVPELLVDIGRLKELQYVRLDGDKIAIGAGTRHATLEGSELLVAECPLLPRSRGPRQGMCCTCSA